MGIVVDTSVFIFHERRGASIAKLREALAGFAATESFVLSSVTPLAELAAGIDRAKTTQQRDHRQTFVAEVVSSFPVLAFTQAMALIAGRIRGKQARVGDTVPFADSLIAATAMSRNDSILTLNVSDFVRVPGLHVIPFLP